MLLDYIYLARNGDMDAYFYLIEHFIPIFNGYVEKYYGKKDDELTLRLLPTIISDYLDSNDRRHIGIYIYEKSRSLFKEGIITLTMLKNDNTQKSINLLCEYYSNRLFEKIKDTNCLLSKNELEKVCYFEVKNRLSRFNNISTSSFLNVMNSYVYSKADVYKKEENIYFDYIKYIGINDVILNYYCDKYNYMLDEFRNEEKYINLKKDFKNIIKEALIERNNKLQLLDRIINKKITDKYFIYKNLSYEDIKNIKNLSVQKQQLVKERYSYIKDRLFEKYKGTIDDEQLRSFIDEKYDKFFNVCINSESNYSISRYMYTRLNEAITTFINKITLENKYFDEHQKEYELNKNTYYYLVDKYFKKCKFYYPIHLNNIYEMFCCEYYKKERKLSFEKYITNSLSIYIKELNNKYDINYINDITNYFINKNIINEDINKKYFNDLEKFYIENELYKTQEYDKYLFNNIRYFDYDLYKKNEEIKRKLI